MATRGTGRRRFETDIRFGGRVISIVDSGPAPLHVVLGEFDTGWQDPAGALQRAAGVIERAAQYSADLVVLPEMCTTGFTMESAQYAEPLGGPATERLSALAARHRVNVIAGLATREGNRFYNSAVLFGADGAIQGEYRKQRLFALGGEDESYEPGTEQVIFDVSGVQIAPLICYDLRFPELFRSVGARVDAFVLIANWPQARRIHWEVLTQARAIENQAYVIAVNRRGATPPAMYTGGSVAWGPWGERLTPARNAEWMQVYPPLRTAIDPAEIGRIRGRYPFVPDQRPVVSS